MHPSIERVVARTPPPGTRGRGSKPARARSIDEFSQGFDTVSSKRSMRRVAARTRRARKLAEDAAAGLVAEKRAEIDAAYEACVPGGSPTQEQRDLVNAAESARFFGDRARSAFDAEVRVRQGYVHPGGIVAGKYLQQPFVERGLRTWWHPFFQRFVASCGTARSGLLRTGPTKEGCVIQNHKMQAMDAVYAFFCDRCVDMFRLDIDRTFDSEAQLRSWIEWVVEEFDLPCAPHVAVWIPDDRAPCKVINPHLWFLLPEGHAVWDNPRHHRLLGQVAAALTRAFKADPGGLACLVHGKNPISPHTGVSIVQDRLMPTLGEWAEALELSWDPERMARELMRGRLEDAGFDSRDSNSYFSFVAKACREAAKAIYKTGADIGDPTLFAGKIAEIAAVADEISPTTHKTISAVEKLIETCSKWAAHNFDADRMDKTGRDRGAAAHLMTADDDAATRMRKGQGHSAGVKVRDSRDAIADAIKTELRAGREPTLKSITATGVRSRNTLKSLFFSAYVQATAELSIQDLVKGVTTPPASRIKPTLAVLSTANRPSDLPAGWRTADLDLHFRQQALRAARQRLNHRDRSPSAEAARVPGRNLMDFLGSGVSTIHRSRVGLLRAS